MKYDNDGRVRKESDGSWTVSSTDGCHEYAVVEHRYGTVEAFDEFGHPLQHVSGRVTLDQAIYALIGGPQ